MFSELLNPLLVLEFFYCCSLQQLSPRVHFSNVVLSAATSAQSVECLAIMHAPESSPCAPIQISAPLAKLRRSVSTEAIKHLSVLWDNSPAPWKLVLTAIYAPVASRTAPMTPSHFKLVYLPENFGRSANQNSPNPSWPWRSWESFSYKISRCSASGKVPSMQFAT